MSHRRTADFPRVPESVAEARTWLEKQLVQLVPALDADLVDRALLGLSEVVTNAVQHGGGRSVFVACTALDGIVTIECVDAGTGVALPASDALPADLDEGGRGLFIVGMISDGDWSWDTRLSGRTRVTFRLHPAPQPTSA